VTKNTPFPGAQTDDLEGYLAGVIADPRTTPETGARLGILYGTRAEDVLRLVEEDPTLGETFDPASPAIAAELVFAITQEFAETLTDVFARRIMLAFEPGHGLQGAERAAEIIGDRLGWTPERRETELAEYRQWLDHLRVP
jgi:glycerol-3-phosphate dehydrogenase